MMSENNKSLFNVIFSGNLNDAKLLVEQGADIYEENKHGETLLHDAARQGKLEFVQFFVELGIDVDHNDNGWRQTPLHQAAMEGNLNCVDYLIKKGANPLEKSINGWNAFHLAVSEGHFQCLKLLIESCCVDISSHDINGKTLLDIAYESLKEKEENDEEAAEEVLEVIGYLKAKFEHDSLSGLIKEKECENCLVF